jgi:opacity protein-like surface antigen
MRSIHATVLLIATLVLCTGSLISAEDARAENDFNKSGGYFGVNGAYGISLLSDEIINAIGGPSGLATFGDSGGLNARLGARFAKILAVELQYEWMHGIDLAIARFPAGTYKPHSLTANLKLYLPISRFQPYLLAGAGVGFWKFESLLEPFVQSGDTTGFAGRVGLGIDLMITEHIGLNAEGAGVLNTASFSFDGLNSISQNLYYFSISGGLIYRF